MFFPSQTVGQSPAAISTAMWLRFIRTQSGGMFLSLLLYQRTTWKVLLHQARISTAENHLTCSFLTWSEEQKYYAETMIFRLCFKVNVHSRQIKEKTTMMKVQCFAIPRVCWINAGQTEDVPPAHATTSCFQNDFISSIRSILALHSLLCVVHLNWAQP